MKRLVFLILFTTCAYSQTPQAFPYIRIGQYIIFDSTGIPTTPGGDSIKVFGRGSLGYFAKFADGSVVRLDSAGAVTLAPSALFEYDLSSDIQPTNGAGWGDVSALWETDILGAIMNTVSGTLDSLYEIDISGNIEPRL